MGRRFDLADNGQPTEMAQRDGAACKDMGAREMQPDEVFTSYSIHEVRKFVVICRRAKRGEVCGGEVVSGNYDDPKIAAHVGRALADQERKMRGLPVGDHHVKFPD